jgi:hypothetical protein
MQSPQNIDLEHVDPMAVIALERDRQRQVCDDLEQLADQLGGPLDVKLCMLLNSQLQIDLPLYHRDEEALFELMLKKDPGNLVLAACTRQAVSQHVTMQGYVFELLEPLGDMRVGIIPRNLDTIGYMLRYCFDCMRHHLQWEDVSIFREQTQELATADQENLRLALIRNRE